MTVARYLYHERPICSLCHILLGSADCSHVWVNGDEITMSWNGWNQLIQTCNRYRSAVIKLDPDGYEAGEYDS